MNQEWKRTIILAGLLVVGVCYVIYMTTIQTPVQ